MSYVINDIDYWDLLGSFMLIVNENGGVCDFFVMCDWCVNVKFGFIFNVIDEYLLSYIC